MSVTAAMPSIQSGFDKLVKYLNRLTQNGFYGKVTLSLQNGKVCDVKIEQTKKLDEL